MYSLFPRFLLPLLATLLPLATLAEPKVRVEQPNFVIIILDDWGWRESGAYGNPRIQTPHIDRLAREGAQFHNAFLTASTCTPSRASILTGQHPFASGAPRLHVPISNDKKLITEYLQQAGYFTASAGKWHLGEAVKDQFDLVIEERATDDQSQTGMEDWLPTLERHRTKNKPFFLWLAAKDAHRPWTAEPIHQAKDMAPPAYIEFNSRNTPEKIRQEMAQYYDEIHRADIHIGQVVKSLKRQGHLDNTVIIVMSDNGSPFWKAKKFLTDPGLKTPFIVHWPAIIKQHQDFRELVSAVDIAPTVLELAGIEIPPQMEGSSFAHWLKNPAAATQPIRDFVYGERGDAVLSSENGRSIRDKKYLYIVDDLDTYTECDDKTKRHTFRREFLFDVVNDPDNLHNLVPPDLFFKRWLGKLSGEKDYGDTLLHYRQLMEQRRQARNDLPRPTIQGACPILWWQEGPTKTDTPDSTDD
jgi:N-sulfoglucosamine sulfohydrolase